MKSLLAIIGLLAVLGFIGKAFVSAYNTSHSEHCVSTNTVGGNFTVPAYVCTKK